MAVHQHQKLVRTKIPDIIRGRGETCQVRTISGSELLKELLKKLVEETKEAEAATTDLEMATELADIYEVLEATEEHLAALKIDRSQVEAEIGVVRKTMDIFEKRLLSKYDVAAIKEEKRQKRGGFLLDDGQGIFLEWTSENPKEAPMSQDVMRFEGVLLEAGVSNRSGRMYSEECLVEMQRQLNAQIQEGKAFIADTTVDCAVQVGGIYGQLDHAGIAEEDGCKKLVVKGHFLPTPKTIDLIKMLRDMKREGETIEDAFDRLFVVRPSGVGKLNEGNVVDPETYKFLCANIFPKDQ